MPPPTFATPTVQRFKCGTWQAIQETLAQEVAVQLSFSCGTKSLWAWPQDLENLAAGHVLLDCLPEAGVLRGAQIASAVSAGEDAAPPSFHVSLTTLGPAPAAPAATVSAQALLEHMTAFIKAPGLWDNTGCFHRAAMLDSHKGLLICVAEDISRHNCVDRLAGYAALQDPDGLHPSRYILLISSRITASLYHKAHRAGFRCMVSRSAVTSGSRNAALAHACTLVGFCRPEEARLTVFADAEGRIC